MNAATEVAEKPQPKAPGWIAPFALLFAPDRAMERHAVLGRARGFFLFAWVCSLLLGAVLALRVDARASTLERLENQGELKSMSERQIEDETRNAARVAQVTTIAKRVVSPPVDLGLYCVAVLLMSWFVRGRLRGSAVVPIASVALVPGAIANLIDAITAYRHASVPPDIGVLGPRSLTNVCALIGRPLAMPWMKFGNALDFFSLWAAVILGAGVAAAGQVPKRRAMIATLVAWMCLRLLTNVATGK